MMRCRYIVFFIVLCGLCMACSSDEPTDDSIGGENGKEEPLPDKGTLFADFDLKRMILLPIFSGMATRVAVRLTIIIHAGHILT